MGTAAQVDAVSRLVRESVASVDAMTPEAIRAVLPALRDARDELQRDLSAWLANAPDGANRFTAAEKAKALRALEGALDRVENLHPAMAQALGLGRRAAGSISVANLDTEIVRLGQIFGESLTSPQIASAAVIAQGDRLLWKRHERSARRYAGDVGNDIKNLFAVGLAKGETFEQLVTRLRRIGGGRGIGIDANAPDDIANGLFARHKHMADRLVRTEVMHAYNVQHDLAISRVNDLRPEGEEEYVRRWDASADVVTCPLCRELHGKIARIGKEFPGGIMNPPRHPYCRCVVLAWLKRWGDMKGETMPTAEVPDTPRKQAPPKPKPAEDVPSRMPPPSKDPNYFPPPTGSDAWAREQARQNRSDAQKRRRTDEAARAKVPVVAPSVPVPTVPDVTPSIEQPAEKKNPKRIEAARKAAAASAARRAEIYSTAKGNLPDELQVAWDQEGHKFMREEAKRIRGIKDPVNAGSKISEAFAEKYGSGEQSVFGNEGDRFQRRAEIEAKHAEKWANDQEAKYYEAAYRDMVRNGEIDDAGSLTKRGRSRAKPDPQSWAQAEPDTSLPQRGKPAKVGAVTTAKAPPVEPPPITADERALPPGARLGSLRRNAMVERYDTGRIDAHGKPVTSWRLNDRGVRHFAQIAAKKEKKSEGIGVCECQVCAAQVALVRGKTSLHGYSRPGFGFIVGSCRGAQELPFELSCTVLAKWISEMRGMLETAKRALANLPNRETFMVEAKKLLPGFTRVLDDDGNDVTDRVNHYRAVYEYKSGTRGKPGGTVRVPEEVRAGDPRFDRAREAERATLTNQIQALTEEINRQSVRLASWSPRPLKGSTPPPLEDAPF